MGQLGRWGQVVGAGWAAHCHSLSTEIESESQPHSYLHATPEPFHLGVLLCSCARRAWKVRFTSAADLVIALEAARRQGRMKELMHRTVAIPKPLIIDEIGYLSFGR